MTIAITPNMTDISMCESTTGWAGGGYLETDADIPLQDTYCLSDWVDLELGTLEAYTFGTPKDMSNGEHLYLWVMCNGVVDTKANGGYRLYAETDASNYSLWYVGGNDTHGTGWQLLCLDLAATRTSGLGTLDLSSIAKVGIQFKTLTPAPIKGQTRFNNVFWDAFRYGTGLTITSGATDDITLENIFGEDNDTTYKWGVVQKSYGAYIITGKLIFGDNAGTGSVDFLDTSQVILFPENDLVAYDFYGVDVVGNGTGVTNFQLGAKSGTSGISGCFVQTSGSNKFHVDATDTDIDVFKVYGSVFVNGGSIDFPVAASGREVINCNFEACGDIDVSTCNIDACNFIDADDSGIVVDSPSWDVDGSALIACPFGIEITVTGEYDSYSNIFSGNDYDLHNTSGSGVIFNNLGLSNAETHLTTSGSTAIVSQKIYTLESLVAGSEVRAYVGTDPLTAVEIAGVETSGSGFSFQHQEGGNTGYIIIHKAPYVPIHIELIYPSVDTTIPIQQRIDRPYSNPP